MKRKKGLKWMDDEISLLAIDKSAIELAKILNRTTSAVYTQRCLLGLSKKHGHSKLVVCENCGNKVKRPASWVNKNNWCNRICWKEWMHKKAEKTKQAKSAYVNAG